MRKRIGFGLGYRKIEMSRIIAHEVSKIPDSAGKHDLAAAFMRVIELALDEGIHKAMMRDQFRRDHQVKEATAERKALGKSTDDSVKKEAENFKHLSKENAAHEIALLINKSPATVRKALSRLFPKDTW
jgi:uncharacterized protein YktA (UPF0223 family)